MGNAVTHKSSTTISSSAPDNAHKKRKRVEEDTRELVDESDGENESKEEVEMKIVELQKLIPGGESLENVDNLFEETAGYILDLQNQIKGLRVLASFFELLEKQKSKLGA